MKKLLSMFVLGLFAIGMVGCSTCGSKSGACCGSCSDKSEAKAECCGSCQTAEKDHDHE